MKRTVFQKLGDFVLGKGFYIVLFLCVATIGISGYYLIRTVSGTPGQAEPVSGNPTVVLPDSSQAATPAQPERPTTKPAETPVLPTPHAQAPDSQSSAGTSQAEAPAPAEPQTEAPADKAPAVYTWPVKGEVLHGYSLEVLAYDETMGDWRTHSGIDIAAETGTNVLAVSDGTVNAVYHDDLMGTTVVVDHGDGLTSSYFNLSDKPTVAAGDSVDTGTVLGVVGKTALAESERPSHLHLEMAQDGIPVDPVNYLPQS